MPGNPSGVAGRTPCLIAALTLLLSVVAFAGGEREAAAHEIRPTIATIELRPDGRFELALSLNLEALIAVIGPEHRDSSTSVNAAEYGRLRSLPSPQLRKAYDAFAPTLQDGLLVEDAGGRRADLRPERIEIPDVGDTGIQRTSLVVYSGRVPAGASVLRWRFSEAFGPSVIRARKAGGDVFFSDYLLNGAGSGDIAVETAIPDTPSSVFLDYLQVGFEHIVPNGLDHMLFVVGLFLLSARLKPLLTQVTCFTLAHSVTLALGALGALRIPLPIVEPLIALSIVYVAAENVWTDRLSRWRPAVIFAFGLLHGLGFASVLTDIGMTRSDFWIGLVAFNVGVECGQMALIAACFLTVGLWFGQKAWYRQRITVPASGLIAAIASVWFLQRVF